MRILWRTEHTRFTWFLLGYISLLNITNFIWSSLSALGLQLTFIDNRNYPGGVIGFLDVEFSYPSNVASLTAYVVGNVLADGLLVCCFNTLVKIMQIRLQLWRAHVIWAASGGSRVKYIMIFPGLLLLASTGEHYIL